MSNLPSYLEKGENLNEKALNFGVLDWHLLEKWQYNHKPVSSQDNRCSASSCNSSPFFSTDVSLNRSSRGRSCSPSHQTLQSHLNVPPNEDYSKAGVYVIGNVEKFQDHKAALSNPLKGQPSVFRMYQSLSKFEPETHPKESKRGDVASLSKGKAKIHDGESPSGQDEFPSLPRSVHRNYCERSIEPNQRRCSLGSYPKELYDKDRCHNILHSCPLPHEDGKVRGSEIKQRNSMDANNINFSSKLSPSRCAMRISTSPSRGKNLEEKKPKVMPRNSTTSKSCEVSDLKKGTVEAPKLRNPSPTRRFSIGLGRIGCNSMFKDSEEHINDKCGSEKAVDSSCSKHASNDRPNSTVRSSSPLRRLLDPLLKPKASSNSHHVPEISRKDPTSQVESSNLQSMKMKLDLTSCKNVSVETSHQKKHGSSKVEALLQIAVKNGLPLYTFAVDNKSDILAATMRKASGSRKDETCWIYTFFSVREVKKKNGWIGHGGKGKNHGIVPNIVAKMKVSDSVDGLSVREFVLFSVDQRQTDQHILDFQPNDEVAAILVKIPRETLRDSGNSGGHNVEYGPIETLRDSCDNGGQNGEDGGSIHCQDLLDMTVILPGGVHGVPSKGEPSPLIERWKSGGSCDCGGWDLGCRLRVLGSETKPTRKSISSRSHQAADRFELFSQQGEVSEEKPIFSLSPFKDGIFSIEFNSSLSFLQAFSICIVIVNSRKPYELSELSKLFRDRCYEETTFPANDGIKGPGQVMPDAPASYASYPPVSPVGRV
ncbi:hypothetical protein NMG60_11014537 [Bertholletia excelsa]